ncbi:hypothetical protein A361_21745 [Cytobacillus oceanisediminis 2691]|uniref:Uncharacterized protein n=2 Tax=Cytobacillus oceanisediminis TaxID=665099 RepID=A0A160MEX4_9BACI|nr:hypothetical protein A361_21745 [Cytobacillus oceanisediminis 2691]OHX50175.1 hypothetical protein BBV17_10235 [Cytobacillus oceanisediminis]
MTLKQITDFPSFTTWLQPFAKDALGRPSNSFAWITFQLLVFLSKRQIAIVLFPVLASIYNFIYKIYYRKKTVIVNKDTRVFYILFIISTEVMMILPEKDFFRGVLKYCYTGKKRK